MSNDLTTIQKIADNVKDLFMSETALANLMNFERVLSELDVYVFDNWKIGELVEGPDVSRHFISCTFMWPYKKKPNERAIDRLELYDCKVNLREGTLRHPVVVKSPEDFKSGTKIAKMVRSKIWLATITIPLTLIEVVQETLKDLESKSTKEDIEYADETSVEEVSPNQLGSL